MPKSNASVVPTEPAVEEGLFAVGRIISHREKVLEDGRVMHSYKVNCFSDIITIVDWNPDGAPVKPGTQIRWPLAARPYVGKNGGANVTYDRVNNKK